ncbi:hypothetical protein [Streptomyces sp. CB01373]|uniref:hypothetical protein n=1 Tax=Streptomyces sp. CB01373 TaxID=2020325 RepID=UPI0018FE845C|nr:hypothetical protein [Streptomyces sp. CB01373]
MEHSDSPTLVPQVAKLVARSGDLKSELVAFVHSPRFARRLDARLEEAADRFGFLDETTAIETIDHFALQHRLADDSTVVERFVAQRRPPLQEDERAMLLGWRDVVEAVFEVQASDAGAAVLHNLLDDLVYRVHSNLGRRALGKLSKGMFVAARIVPVHPDTGAWLVSGNLTTYAPSDGPQLAHGLAAPASACAMSWTGAELRGVGFLHTCPPLPRTASPEKAPMPRAGSLGRHRWSGSATPLGIAGY